MTNNMISLPWELGDCLRKNPNVAEEFRSPELWRGFLRARTDTLIEYRRFKSRFTAAEIELSKQFTAYVVDDTETFTITICLKNKPILEVCGKWKYCTDSNSAYCGMKTAIEDWSLKYDPASGFRSESTDALLTFVACCKESSKLRIPQSIFL